MVLLVGQISMPAWFTRSRLKFKVNSTTFRNRIPLVTNRASEINGSLNPSGVEAAAAKLFPTDRAYGQVLDGVRGQLGRNIDFSNQGDREAIGNALINHIRQPGGNDVTGAP